MNIKVRSNTTITEDIKDYCQKRFSKIEKMLPEGSFLEIEFIDDFGQRQGEDKRVEANLSLPNQKQAVYLYNATADWGTSIDIVKDRLEEEVIKYKEKNIDRNRKPRKDKQ